MAYHKLETDEEFTETYEPLEAGQHTGVDYSNPKKARWVRNTECEEFTGTSFIVSIDINTYIFIYLSVFHYKRWCWLGVSTTVWFRQGRVDNAWVGFAMFDESYINGRNESYLNANMAGEAWVYSLQAEDDTSLKSLYVNSFNLTGWNSNITTLLRDNEYNRVQCGAEPTLELEEDDYQFAKWYCVRPFTKEYKFYTDVNYDDHTYASQNPFGFIWSYGEGVFANSNMHASRGACAMYFNQTYNTTEIIDGAYVCLQEGNVVSTTNSDTVKQIAEAGNYVNGFDTFFEIVSIDPEEFIEKAEFILGDIPDATSATDYTWIIVGAVAGVFAVCILVAVCCFCCRDK